MVNSKLQWTQLMHSQNDSAQASRQTAGADEWFRDYCALLMRDSWQGEKPTSDQQAESAYDIKA